MAFGWFKKKQDSHQDIKDSEISLPDESDGACPAANASKAAGEPEEREAKVSGEENFSGVLPETTGSEGFFKRLKNRLSRTRKSFTQGLDSLFAGKSGVTPQMLEDLEELLITSDLGVETATELISRISRKASGIRDAEALKLALKEEIRSLIVTLSEKQAQMKTRPHVVMVLGVNGVGKTTTIGKLAARASREGRKVIIAAADTFRAAAVEQLAIWAERSGADLVKHKAGADPAAVAYDAVEAARARGADIVLIDTAGRIHTKANLMEELKKIKRSIAKAMPDAPHEALLVLDATTGQNALSQARLFNESIGVTGIAMTKLDGTAKGGIVVGICHSLKIPLRYIGIGEQIEDLQEFDPDRFVDALF